MLIQKCISYFEHPMLLKRSVVGGNVHLVCEDEVTTRRTGVLITPTQARQLADSLLLLADKAESSGAEVRTRKTALIKERFQV